uniref:SRCR domain-containing protein n=1 Tax=Callorhinchus milii TaxID=7868 RepID=A0A4W3GJG2_CALMI
INLSSALTWHLRLESGGSRCDGRVEIYHNGTWGRLLDDSWNISDGDVICRQLNCGSAISVYNSSQYGEGTGPVWINNVQCMGTETHIWNCPHSTVASSSWSSSDVGVLRSGDICHQWKPVVLCYIEIDHMKLRLVDGGSSCSGTVEVYRLGNWRRVRDQFWDLSDANVVCRQMGCGPAMRAYNSPVHREGERSPWLKDVRCQGNEANLLKCKPSRRNQSTEKMSDVGVQCSSCCTSFRNLLNSIYVIFWEIRLMDGGSSCAGRVEILFNGTWGTVCDDSWGSLEADVVCKQLGCGSAVHTTSAATCGRASGPVWLDEVRCSGKESHDCDHKEDVSIVCTGKRLNTLCFTGRVEVFYNGTWGTVCSDSMRRKYAEVICKQLYCGEAVAVDDSRQYDRGSGPIWLDDIVCNSQESFLWQCSSPPWGEHDCDHTDDLRVICSGNEMFLSRCGVRTAGLRPGRAGCGTGGVRTRRWSDMAGRASL